MQRRWVISLGAVAAVALLGYLLAWQLSLSAPGVTWSNALRVQEGIHNALRLKTKMRMEDLEGILGRPPDTVEPSDEGGTYVWVGELTTIKVDFHHDLGPVHVRHIPGPPEPWYRKLAGQLGF
jgi:hypothetical protein